VEPAFADGDSLQEAVDELVSIRKLLNPDYKFKVLTPDDVFSKFFDIDFYPSEKALRENIVKHSLDGDVSANDLSIIIHDIIQRSTEISDYLESVDSNFDADVVFIRPNKDSIVTRFCVDDVVFDLGSVGVINEFSDNNIKSVFSNLAKSLEIDLTIEAIVDLSGAMKEFNSSQVLVTSFDDVLLSVGSSFLWRKSDNSHVLSLAIYTRVLEIWRESDCERPDSFSLESFSIGSGFMTSLECFQCGPGGRFGGTLFDVVTRLVAGEPKSGVDEFRTTTNKTSAQRCRGDYLAYRTHVTKGSEGIRLMIWKSKQGEVELANVGNKFDLNIES